VVGWLVVVVVVCCLLLLLLALLLVVVVVFKKDLSVINWKPLHFWENMMPNKIQKHPIVREQWFLGFYKHPTTEFTI
jgi:hypothetical protein